VRDQLGLARIRRCYAGAPLRTSPGGSQVRREAADHPQRSASVMRGYIEEGSIWNDNAAARLGL
jgi:hypothetical protein